MTRSTRSSLTRRLLPALMAVSALSLAACGGGDSASTASDTAAGSSSAGESPAASSQAATGGGSITVGGANFTEINILQEMYKALLEDAGYTVDIITADNRELYAKSLQDGQIDVVPEYAATFAEYVNRQVNGPDAPGIATTDPATTVAAAQPLAQGLNMVLLDPADAADQNGFAVLKSYADANSLKTLSDLATLGKPIRLAATEECPTRPFCGQGLTSTYGLNISENLPLGFGSPQAKQAVVDGQADLVLTGTTDATLDGLGLVLLTDDKKLQQADNLVPVVNADTAKDATVVDTLNKLSSVLTTADLTKLNGQVDAERQQAADVAKAYLQDKGLIG